MEHFEKYTFTLRKCDKVKYEPEKCEQLYQEIDEYVEDKINEPSEDLTIHNMYQSIEHLINLESKNNRTFFIKNYSWAIPDRNVIDKMTRFINGDKCLEIFSGSGLWAYLLKQNGNYVIATDNKSEPYDTYYDENIYQMDYIKAIETYTDCNVLMICWGRHNFEDFAGDKIIYIGENEKGSTFGIPDNDIWELQEKIEIRQFKGSYDFVMFYIRK